MCIKAPHCINIYIYTYTHSIQHPKRFYCLYCGIAAKPSSVKQKTYNLALSSGEKTLIIHYFHIY